MKFIRSKVKFLYGFLGTILFLLIFRTGQFRNKELPEKVIETGKKSPRFDNIAIALKTGKDVAIERTPIQLLTFLSDVRNLLIIGESPNVWVGDIPVVDVVTNLYGKHQKRGVEEVTPDQNSDGWKFDTHKNLPGLKKLYESYPDADWYMMIDDDTYLLMDNIEQYLKNKNPNELLYTGSANVFKGCGDVRKFSLQEMFAHGGSGILMSKAALKKILPIIDICITRDKDCWAGDIRVGLCFRTVGIRVQNEKGFSKDPPNEKFKFDDPCKVPLTFHHLLGKQAQLLYNTERDAKRKGLTVNMELIAKTFLKNDLLKNVDRLGGEYDWKQINSPEECRNLCIEDKRCVVYSYYQNEYGTGAECSLKEYIGGASLNQINSYTGLVLEHFQCKSNWNPWKN